MTTDVYDLCSTSSIESSAQLECASYAASSDQECCTQASADHKLQVTPASCGGCDAMSSSDEVDTPNRWRARVQDASATSSKKQQQAALGLQRASVVNWMVEMGYCLYQSNDVLHLAVMCYDRCCRAAIAPAITACKQHPTASSSSSVDSRPPPVQLVALACLWVAAKYQSVKAPPAGTLLQVMPGSGYVTSDLAAAERWVLAKLGYSLGSGGPTIKEQLHAILEEHTSLALPLPQQLYPLTSYIAELALLEAALLDTPSGLVAAAAYWYASALLGCPLGDAALQRVTSFGLHQVKPVGTWLSAVHATVTQAAAAGSPYSSTSKYLLPEYKEVAAVGTALLLRGAPLA